MDLAFLVKTLRGLLPKEVRVVGSVDNVEAEPVGWDFYGNITEVEYTSTPLANKVSVTLYWEEPTGFVGMDTEITASTLSTMSVTDVEILARLVVSTIQHRRENGYKGTPRENSLPGG